MVSDEEDGFNDGPADVFSSNKSKCFGILSVLQGGEFLVAWQQ